MATVTVMASVTVGSRTRRLAAWAFLGGPAACGGQSPIAPSPPTPPPTTLAPATLADLSASVTSPDRQLSCRDDVHARVTLTNRAASGVLVNGVRRTSSIVSGNCNPAPEFTYAMRPRLVGPNSTSVVFDGSLYSGGSGCCVDPKRCGGTCEIQEEFQVVTGVGSVPAGSFRYRVSYSSSCGACGVTTASATHTCLRPQ